MDEMKSISFHIKGGYVDYSGLLRNSSSVFLSHAGNLRPNMRRGRNVNVWELSVLEFPLNEWTHRSAERSTGENRRPNFWLKL